MSNSFSDGFVKKPSTRKAAQHIRLIFSTLWPHIVIAGETGNNSSHLDTRTSFIGVLPPTRRVFFYTLIKLNTK